MDAITPTDRDLVCLAQKGDLKAYNILLNRHQQKMKQLILFYINDPAQANDLMQEVFLKVVAHFHEFKEESEFATWLYRIAQNTIKNHFRAMSLRLDSELLDANEHYLSFAASPEHQLLNKELGDLIEQAITQLPEELRLCYGMHIVEGKSYEAIAKRLHCPIGTVRSRIYRARKSIRECCIQIR